MLKVTSIGVENFRSLVDTGAVELKPITILVGRNSSGKSSFARILPLLKQSSEASKRGPLLWWGKLVDFGSFATAVNRHVSNKEIAIKFSIDFAPEDLRSSVRRSFGRLSILRALSPGKLNVVTFIKESDVGSYVSKITISLFDFSCEILLNDQGFVEEMKFGLFSWKKNDQTICFATQDQLLPNPAFFRRVQGEQEGWEAFDPFRSELSKLLRFFVHGNTAEEKVRQLATKIPLGTREDIFNSLLTIANPASFRESLHSWGRENINFRRLCDYAFASHLDALIERVNVALSGFSKDVIYLEPLRANAQRYYRQQALSVEEIDSKGENIAMFLDNLSWHQLQDFNKWAEIHFGIQVLPHKEGGHVSLKIKQKTDGSETNIADMGFGFSQMLPIAVQLWAVSSSTTKLIPGIRAAANPIVVIEQPELHLHPDYQARIADVFVAAVGATEMGPIHGERTKSVRIIAETHSPEIINRLGALVGEGAIDRDMVQIILFEQKDSQSPAVLRVSKFDEEGVLINWPTGFFTPSIYAN